MTSLPILLPYGFTSLVRQNDTVTVGQKIAHNTAPQEEVINIAKELGISIRKARKVLQKNPGDAVAHGDVIAFTKKFFGLQKEAVVSKISGTILKYERDTGNLYIRTSYANLTDNFVSPVDGIVTLCDNEKIVIAVDKNVLLGTNATEAKTEGEIFIFEEASSANRLFFIDSRVTGKIVVGERLDRESLTKSIALGAIGFIGTGLEPRDLTYVSEKHAHIPVIEIDQESLQKILPWNNKKIYLDGQARSIILLQV